MKEDQSTEKGALHLCAKITAYWARRGRRITCVPFRHTLGADNRDGNGRYIYGIRSNTINGLPPKCEK